MSCASGMSRPRSKLLDLAAVYRETRKAALHLKSTGCCSAPGPPTVHDFGDGHSDGGDRSMIPLFSTPRSAGSSPSTCGSCCFAISSDDAVAAGLRVSAASGCAALVLNFASKNLPGGAVASGVNAQEECIFRQTTISSVLPPENPPSCYPMPPRRVVITRDVAVLRGSHPDYEWLPPPFTYIDVASSAAVSKPALHPGDDQQYANPEEMRMRVTSVLQAAARNGSSHLVLGAWGCGGFRNPAQGLAEIFRAVLVDAGYDRFFRYIEFAIPGEGSKHAVCFHSVFKDIMIAPMLLPAVVQVADTGVEIGLGGASAGSEGDASGIDAVPASSAAPAQEVEQY